MAYSSHHLLAPQSRNPDSLRSSELPSDDPTAAFKEMSVAHPLYGKHSRPPLTPEAWWSTLIGKCMLHAGATEYGELQARHLAVSLTSELAQQGDRLTQSLLARFESDVGYRNFPDTLSTCKLIRTRRGDDHG